MMKKDWVYHRGDVYVAELVRACGSVQDGVRPVLLMQNNAGNFFGPTLIVVPLTSKIKKQGMPTHYTLDSEFLSEPSMVLAEQVMTIDKQQIRKYLEKIKREDMRAIDDVLRISLGLVIPEDVEVAC